MKGRRDNPDKNQAEIVVDLRKAGFSVETGHHDIVVGKFDLTGWYEIKNINTISTKTGTVMPSKLRDSEKKRLLNFKGHYKIAWTSEQIINDPYWRKK